MKSFFVIIAVCGFAYLALDYIDPLLSGTSSISQGNDKISQAYSNQSSGIQVSGKGEVIRVLPDDNKGSRHQKFVLKLNSNQTLLISHNIDLAPRVSSLRVGDSISFNGVYEWNSQGGVVHWTHHDPKARHANGWLKKGTRKYQ